MSSKSSIFEKTYGDYLGQVAKIDFDSVAKRLNVKVEEGTFRIPMFGIPYRISSRGITDPSGKRPSFDICVILCKYLLLCPDTYPTADEWVSFRDLKDAGPLTTYFSNDVERAIANEFSGRLDDLKKSSQALGGYVPAIELSYDLAVQLDPLPRVPVLLTYNDADDEFPAKCSVLFERRVEKYLDAECIAMVGAFVFTSLRKAGD